MNLFALFLGFDGGDCCSCTCIHGTKWQCGANAFNCVDPDASCSTEAEDNTPTNNDGTSSNNAGDGEVDGDREESGLERYPECVSGSADFIGDSYCDPQNNSQACGEARVIKSLTVVATASAHDMIKVLVLARCRLSHVLRGGMRKGLS